MQRITITIGRLGVNHRLLSSGYVTWFSEERPTLFESLSLYDVTDIRLPYSIPKTGSGVAKTALQKILSIPSPWSDYRQISGEYKMYYHNAGGYWNKAFTFQPFYRRIDGKKSGHSTISVMGFPTAELRDIYTALVNSGTFYFFWKTLTDARHLYPSDIAMFPLPLPLPPSVVLQLQCLLPILMTGFQQNSRRIIYGNTEVDQFDVAPVKSIIDEIDQQLAPVYHFNEAEFDYVVNFDHRFRGAK